MPPARAGRPRWSAPVRQDRLAGMDGLERLLGAPPAAARDLAPVRLVVLALLLLGLVLCVGLLVAAVDFSAVALNPQPEPPG